MATYVENASIFVDAFHTLTHFLFEYIQLPVGRHGSIVTLHSCGNIERSAVECIADFFEYPRTSEGGATHHHCVHTIFLKTAEGICARGDVAIADDGDVHARIALHFANERPIGFSCVHLATRATVNGERFCTTILDALCQIDDDAVFVVPA